MALWILRACFLVVAIGLGASLISSADVRQFSTDSQWMIWVVFGLFVAGSVITILADVFIKNKRIDMISSLYFGLVVGFLLTYIVKVALTPLFDILSRSDLAGGAATAEIISSLVMSFLGSAICYSCVSLLWQTKDDFRFVIPYVEFSKDVKGLKPYVLDTSVVIDGRIADVIDTGVIDNALVMPRFVLAELQAIADSSDKMRRAKGRRGLDVLDKMRKPSNDDFEEFTEVFDKESKKAGKKQYIIPNFFASIPGLSLINI